MNRSRIAVVGIDADDTLWHNETVYREAEAIFCDRLGASTESEAQSLRQELLAKEKENVPLYGYGIKSFVLSMIETAVAQTGDEMSVCQIREVIGIARWMIEHEVLLLDGVASTLRLLHEEYELALITKGDLLDQKRKLSRSGIAGAFDRIEVVSEKNREAYEEILLRCGIAPQQFVMIGNSLKSDILPVVAIGAAAIHIPYPYEWEHERLPHSAMGSNTERWLCAQRFDEVPALVRSILA